MSVNTKYTDKPNDQYQRANLKGLVGYFHKRCKQPLPTFYKICFGNLNFSTLFCQRFVAAHTAAAQSQTQSKAAVRAATPTHNRADYNTISSCAKREQQNFFKHIQYVRIEGHFAFVDPKKK